jgi:hypothetical protein
MKIKNIFKQFSIVNREIYRENKDFASRFRDSRFQTVLYNNHLMNLTHTLYLVKKSFEKVIFIGPNPDILLTSLPWSKTKS